MPARDLQEPPQPPSSSLPSPGRLRLVGHPQCRLASTPALARTLSPPRPSTRANRAARSSCTPPRCPFFPPPAPLSFAPPSARPLVLDSRCAPPHPAGRRHLTGHLPPHHWRHLRQHRQQPCLLHGRGVRRTVLQCRWRGIRDHLHRRWRARHLHDRQTYSMRREVRREGETPAWPTATQHETRSVEVWSKVWS